MIPFVRVSTLEKFRRVVQTEWETAAALEEYVRAGQDAPAPSWQAAAGTAWHKALEARAVEGCLAAQHAAGYSFDMGAVMAAHQVRGPGLRELTATRAFETPAGPLEVKGTADHVYGLTVRDAKAKFSTPDAKDYEPSLQWRFYLHLFECSRFTYDLFSFKDPDADGYCEAKGVDSFSFFAYPGMAAELAGWCHDFLRWAQARGLTRFLLAPAAPAEAAA